jgi:hypothetical protein
MANALRVSDHLAERLTGRGVEAARATAVAA